MTEDRLRSSSPAFFRARARARQSARGLKESITESRANDGATLTAWKRVPIEHEDEHEHEHDFGRDHLAYSKI